MKPRSGADVGLLGATAAASYLGISRTSLHRETKLGKLAPDVVTRGGQRRFLPATLDAYRRQHMGRTRPADDATPDAKRWASLAQIAQLASISDTEEEICRAALPLVYAALPGTEFAYVVSARPPAYDPLEMRRYGHGELESAMGKLFRALGPRSGYLTPRLIARGEMVIFGDLLNDPVLRGTESNIFVQAYSIRSYLGMPLMRDDVPIGLLAVGSREAHLYHARDVPYVRAAADVLVSALTAHGIQAELLQAHIAITRLVAEGLRSQPAVEHLSDEARRAQLGALIELYRAHSGAHVVGIQGLGCDVIPAHQHLTALMRSATTPGVVALCPHGSWEGDEPCTCMAIGVARPDGAQGAVGVTWRGQRQYTAHDSALLAAFATTCLLMLTRLA